MGKLDFKGGEIHYTVKGKGRAMVMLHGFLESKEIWKNFIAELSSSFKVIAIDLPAHGSSSTYGYVNSMEEMAEAVRAVLLHLNVRKSIIVGHSMGGYVAMAYGEKFSDFIIGIVMFHSTAKADNAERKKSRKKMMELVKLNKEKIISPLIQSLFHTTKKPYKRTISQISKKANEMDIRSIVSTIEGLIRRKEREIVLKFAPYPLLYIIGEHDAILPHEMLIEESKISINGYYILLKDTGHMGMFEAEKTCIDQLRKFGKHLKV